MSETRDPELERLLRPDEVAAILGVPLRTIYRWRSHQEGPRVGIASDDTCDTGLTTSRSGSMLIVTRTER